MSVLVIDNYDSFTYNLVQYIADLGYIVKVVRNDAVSLEAIKNIAPDCIIISPGPGSPRGSEISLSVIQNLSPDIPVLGVCLGHQSIGYIYNARISHASYPVHGKTSVVYHSGCGLFAGIQSPLVTVRYHSLIIGHNRLPEDLEITAWTPQGIIMACQHKLHPNLYGVQFHVESLWTPEGKSILQNFLSFQK